MSLSSRLAIATEGYRGGQGSTIILVPSKTEVIEENNKLVVIQETDITNISNTPLSNSVEVSNNANDNILVRPKNVNIV